MKGKTLFTTQSEYLQIFFLVYDKKIRRDCPFLGGSVKYSSVIS